MRRLRVSRNEKVKQYKIEMSNAINWMCVMICVGIDSISIDMKGKMLTVIGTVDPVSVASKLRKFWPTDIVVVGPAKEPEKKEEKKEEGKKEEPKKEEAKKEEPKKEEPKKEEAKKEEPKKEEAKKEEEKKKEPEPMMGIMQYRPYYPPMQYRPYYPPPSTYYVNQGVEENPNACTIF